MWRYSRQTRSKRSRDLASPRGRYFRITCHEFLPCYSGWWLHTAKLLVRGFVRQWPRPLLPGSTLLRFAFGGRNLSSEQEPVFMSLGFERSRVARR